MAIGNITKDASKVTSKGGGVVRVRFVNDDFTPIVGQPWFDIGYIEESTKQTNQDNEDRFDESGYRYTVEEKTYTEGFTCKLAQFDNNFLDVIQDFRTKTAQVYKLNVLNSSVTSQTFYAGGKWDANTETTFPGGTTQWTFRAYSAPSNITVSGAALTASVSSGCGAVGSTSITQTQGTYSVNF